MRRVQPYAEISPLEFLRLRETMGLGQYRKQRPRDPAKWRLLRELYLTLLARRETDEKG